MDPGSLTSAVGDISAGVAAAGTRLADLQTTTQRSNDDCSAGESANTALRG